MDLKDNLNINVPITLKQENDTRIVEDLKINTSPPLVMKDTLKVNALNAIKLQADKNNYKEEFPKATVENILHKKDIFRVNTTTARNIVNFEPSIYGFKIEINNPDPYNRITYTEEAKGMIPGSNKWFETEIFKDIRPCVVLSDKSHNCEVNYYLNPNDLTKKIDGTSSDIVTGNDGDVMVEIPQIWTEVTHDDSFLYIKLAREKPKTGNYFCLTHQNFKNLFNEHVYRGCFECTLMDHAEYGKRYRSIATGKLPTVDSISLDLQRKYSQRNIMIGDSKWVKWYHTDIDFQYIAQLWQHLFLLFYKTTNSQSIFKGNCTKVVNTVGQGLKKGPNWGSSMSNSESMGFLWIENLWGNTHHWLDGILCSMTGVSDRPYKSSLGFMTRHPSISIISSLVEGSNFIYEKNKYTRMISVQSNGDVNVNKIGASYLFHSGEIVDNLETIQNTYYCSNCEFPHPPNGKSVSARPWYGSPNGGIFDYKFLYSNGPSQDVPSSLEVKPTIRLAMHKAMRSD